MSIKQHILILFAVFLTNCIEKEPITGIYDCNCGVVSQRWEQPDSLAPHGVITSTVITWNCDGEKDTVQWYLDMSDCYFLGDTICKLLPTDSLAH